jgi:hypothetical protein
MEAALFVINYDDVFSKNILLYVEDETQRRKHREIELFLNQLSHYSVDTVDFNYIELKGWAFDTTEDIVVQLTDDMNGDVDAVITKNNSLDVYNHFNGAYENASSARFVIHYPNNGLNYHLRIANETGEEIIIPVGENIAGAADDSSSTIIYHIDSLNYVHYSTEANENDVKLNISNFIINMYKRFNPVVTFLAVLALLPLSVLALYRLRKKKTVPCRQEIIILWGLFFAFLCRTVMIAYVDVSAFPAISVLYLASSYPIMILFNGLALCCVVNFIKQQKNAPPV